MRTIYFLTLCLLVLFLESNGQRGLTPIEKDSLWGVWSDPAAADTTRLKALQRFAWHGYLYSKPDSAFYYGQLHYDFSEARGLLKPMSSALNIQATALNFQGEFDDALEYYDRSLQIGREIGDRQGVGVCLNNMGNIYKNQGVYSKAIECFFESLAIREEINDSIGIASSWGNISNTYKSLGDYENSLQYALRCLNMMEELANLQGVAGTLNNIGLLYEQMGDFAKALDYHERGLGIRRQIGDQRGVSDSMMNVGNVRRSMGDYEEAQLLYEQSLIVAQESKNHRGVAQALYNMGRLKADQEKIIESIRFSERALPIAVNVGDVEVIRDVSELLYQNYRANNQPKLALEMFELFVDMRDSITRTENKSELLKRQFQYDYEKREANLKAEQEVKMAQARLELLQERSERRLLLFSLFLTFLIVAAAGWYFYQRKKTQFRYQTVLLELKAIKAQISPHFLFNALNSAVNMISNQREDEAEQFLIKYSRLMRQTLRDSDRDLTTLEDELDVLRNYLDLERIRLKERFSYHIELDQSIVPSTALIPSMLIQPLLENAVWHGVAQMEGDGRIEISFRLNGSSLAISVQDNGMGGLHTPSRKDGGPAGLAITEQRIALYNQQFGMKGRLKLSETKPGVRAEFSVPLIQD